MRGKKVKNKTVQSENKKEQIYSDVLGSYTGTPLKGETPVQDADDL